MALTETPVCDFGLPAPDFRLEGTDGRFHALADCRGEQATLVMFICNHCPYVQAIRQRLVQTLRDLQPLGVRGVAIMPNDTDAYPEDGLERMREAAAQFDFPFPYLFDQTQEVARAYGAVCTPDFFGYNADLKLQYRGRLDAGRLEPPPADVRRDLYEAMKTIATSGAGPQEQFISAGCSIKWRA